MWLGPRVEPAVGATLDTDDSATRLELCLDQLDHSLQPFGVIRIGVQVKSEITEMVRPDRISGKDELLNYFFWLHPKWGSARLHGGGHAIAAF